VYIKYESEKLEEERNSGHLGVDKILKNASEVSDKRYNRMKL
jgi:hypothetical protein